uniref:Uncharacterized protein n=1 Tax=Oryza brachyantha TaxID=4533 RepID=J3MEL5_ORYBR
VTCHRHLSHCRCHHRNPVQDAQAKWEEQARSCRPSSRTSRQSSPTSASLRSQAVPPTSSPRSRWCAPRSHVS